MSDFLRNLSLQQNKKPKSLFIRYLKRIFLIFLYATICISVVGIRKDIHLIVDDSNFWLELLLIFLLTVNAIVLSVKVSTYGQEKKLNTKKIWFLLISWISLNFSLLVLNKNFHLESISSILNHCFGSSFLISFIPAAFLIVYYRRNGILYAKWLGLSAFLVSAMSSAIFLQMSCPSSDPWHNLGSHTVPVLVISSLGMFIFKYLSRG